MDTTTYLLGSLLKAVSRSFYLTLRVLPAGVREPVGLAYLLARAADTIADTAIIPAEKRLELLLVFRSQMYALDASQLNRIEAALGAHQSNPHERILLQSLPPAIALLAELPPWDRFEVQNVVTILTRGMELDLCTFPFETSGKVTALHDLYELDRYIYLVAGCVGEFWTKMTAAHTPALHHWDINEMSARGVRFGKALQLTNVLRDCPKDLRIGRCYLPLDRLNAIGLQPEDLLDPAIFPRVRPLQCELLRLALGHYQAACQYLLAIPPACGRLRLACLWPILIGLSTLKELAENKAWLDPSRPSKVSRRYVWRCLSLSLPIAGSDTLIEAWISKLSGDVERAIIEYKGEDLCSYGKKTD